MTASDEERLRRWRLALGEAADDAMALSERDRRVDAALAAVYEPPASGKTRGTLKSSAPRVARWLGDIREFFPASVVQVVQRDAFERLGLKRMLLEPELLSTLEADVHLVADLVSLRAVMPEKTIATARMVIRKVVRELMERLESRTVQAIRGALDRATRNFRPRHNEIDWQRTIRANLKHYQPEYRTVVPETRIGYGRKSRRSNLEDVILCIDQSGSMATSVVYASIFAAVLASIPAIATRLVVFDTAVLDLTEDLADPVEILFGVQLGGGTDIAQALGYCETLIDQPSKTHLILVSDLFEGGDAESMHATAAALVAAGVNVIVLLALSDDGRPASDENNARRLAALGIPVFACTPDLFPELMAAALKRQDIAAWAAGNDIKTTRGESAAE
jgi:Mg-chelatase subunit ChlD